MGGHHDDPVPGVDAVVAAGDQDAPIAEQAGDQQMIPQRQFPQRAMSASMIRTCTPTASSRRAR